MKRLGSILVAISLAGCSDFPSFGDPEPGFGDWATYPRLVPLDALIIRALGPTAAPTRPTQPLDVIADPLAARIDALNRRAAILRGAPVDDTTRSLISDQ